MNDSATSLIIVLLVLAFFLGFVVGMDLVNNNVDAWADEYCVSAGHSSGEWEQDEGILCYDLNVYSGELDGG